jgi:putative hydrolase of HD superfamily
LPLIPAELLLEVLRLKELPRAGWLRVGINAPESVAGHSWGLAWLVLLLCPDELDRERALSLALVHDLPEILAGDITPHDNISAAEKHRLEAEAADRLFAQSPRLRALWQEYADHATPESRLVHELDKLDMALQAIRYRLRDGADTDEFVHSALSRLSDPQRVLLRSVLSASLADPE